MSAKNMNKNVHSSSICKTKQETLSMPSRANKYWYISTMKCYIVMKMKKKKLLVQATWINPPIIILSENNQKAKESICIIPIV